MGIINKIQLSILLFFLLFFNTLVFAQKTDKLFLLNGDEITCEIKKLEFGLLTAKTDDIGTLTIKWNRVKQIISKEYFEIELIDGTKYFGPLIDSEKDRVVRVFLYDSSMIDLDIENIVVMDQIMEKFSRRFSGSFSIGFDIQKANSLARLTTNANIDYRYRANFVSILWNSVNTDQQDSIYTQRMDLNLRYVHSYKNRWLFEAHTTLQNNTELDLDLRIIGGLGPGRIFIHSDHYSISGILGIVYNKEWNVGIENSISNLEGWLRLEYRHYIYVSPKIDIFANVEYYPSFTTNDRHRVEFYADANREIINDLHLGLAIQYSFDSKLPSTGSPNDDWVVSIILGYSFN